MRLALMLLVLATAVLTGCAAAVVAGAASAGYVATDEEAGASVGEFFRKLDAAITRQISGSEQTRRKLNYRQSQGLVVRLLDGHVQPRRQQRGGAVTLKLEYAVLGAPPGGVQLHLRESLWFHRERLTTVYDDRFSRTDGTWEDSFQIGVPATAEPGVYVLGIVLSSGKTEAKHHLSFTVTP